MLIHYPVNNGKKLYELTERDPYSPAAANCQD